jgi:hypothetical protein
LSRKAPDVGVRITINWLLRKLADSREFSAWLVITKHL